MCIAVQIGGILQYKLEVYCGVSLSPKLRSQQGTALQMGGVLLLYRQVVRVGVPKQCPVTVCVCVCETPAIQSDRPKLWLAKRIIPRRRIRVGIKGVAGSDAIVAQ